MIKNIKFKVPIQYTKHFMEDLTSEKDTNVESTATATSVIVNNNNIQSTSVEHWRRRTSQNLGLKN